MPAAADIVRSFLAALGGDDPDAVADHVASGFLNEHQSALGAGSRGRAEYRRRLPDFLAAFEERRYSIDDVVEARRGPTTVVVVRYRFEARHGGRRIAIPGVMWFEVGSGAITRRIDTWDSLTFLRQSGQA